MALTPAAVASPQQLYQGQPGTTNATLFTAPANTANVTSPSATAYVTELVIANTTATAATITLYLVPSGGTAGVGNALMESFSVAPNNTQYLSDLKTFMPAGSTLQGLQGTAGAITVTASGAVVQ